VRRESGQLRDALPSLGAGLDAYRRDLRRLVAAGRDAGVAIVLVTQPALWDESLPSDLRRLLWMGKADETHEDGTRAYYSPGALADGLSRYNEVLLQICEEESLHCIDLANDLPRDTSVFYDDLHFNESGARLVADKIAAVLLPTLRIRS